MAKDTKACPWCGEQIKKAAIICRFCHNDATQRGRAAARQYASAKEPPAPRALERTRPTEPVQSGGDEEFSRLSKFMPQNLLSSIVEGSEAIDEGERRPISVLFSDLVGFTSLTERIGAEAMSDLLDLIYAGIREVVSKYDGRVEKFIGDAVMALFGAPTTHGDDPERAVRAGLEIREVVKRIGSAQGYDLDTHSGVAFGEVVFKAFGEDGRLDFRTIGDAVNLASRLQGLAGSGETLVDHRIYLQTRTTFDWDHREPVLVKGKKSPVLTHLVTAIRKEFSKVVLGERIDLAPLVGRQKDLDRLTKATQEARQSGLRTVLVQADAGVGKSRLVYELYHRLPDGEFNWHTGHCLSFGANIPFLPIKTLIKSIFRLSRQTDQAVTLEDLREGVEATFEPAMKRLRSQAKKRALSRQAKAIINAIAVMMGVEIPNNPILKLTPQERREAIFEAVADLIRQLIGQRLTVLVFEDLHWCDEDSLELIDYLMGALSKQPVVVLILARPELIRPFAVQPERLVHVQLSELSGQDSVRLLHNLLGFEGLPNAVVNRLLVKTDGNPFFIEEIVLNLENHGVLERVEGGYRLKGKIEDVEIPDTVEALILARLDRLERRIKRILQCAAVIGQEFRYETLAHVTEIGMQLQSHLFELVDDDYVNERTLLPELAYIFRHVLLRDVAYSTLLIKRRRHFHARVGQVLESLFPDKLNEYYEILAHHYEHGQVTEKALYYLEKAAVKCEDLYANHAAADHWERLLGVLKREGSNKRERRKLRVEANLRLSEICRRLGWPERGVQACQAARTTAQSLGDRDSATKALLCAGELHRIGGRVDLGLTALRDALKVAKASRQEDLIAVCQNYVGHFERMQGNFPKARTAFEAVLSYAEKAGDRQRRFQALNHLGIIQMYAGKTEEANSRFEQAMELAVELKMRREMVQIKINLGLNHLRLGNCDVARSRLGEAAAEGEKIEFERGVQLALIGLIDVHLKTGDNARAATLARQLLKRNAESRFSDVRALALTNQARALIALERLGEAESNLDEAMRISAADGNYVGQIDALSVRAESLLKKGAGKRALAAAEKMLDLVNKHREKEFLAPAQTLCARARLTLKQADEARKLAQHAIRASRRSGVPRDEGWAQWTLALCEEALGQRTRFAKAAEASFQIGQRVQDSALTSAARGAII